MNGVVGQLIPRTRTVVTCRQWPDGQPVRRVAYATWRPRKQSKKKGERATKGKREGLPRSGGATAQHRGAEGGERVVAAE